MISPFKLGMFTLPLFLAESTTAEVKSSALGEWLVIGAAVLVIVQIGWGFLDRVRGGPMEKREVSFAEEFVTKQEMKQAHGRIERERKEVNDEIAKVRQDMRDSNDKLGDALRDLRLEIKQDNKGVHDRINEILEAVSELRGRVEG